VDPSRRPAVPAVPPGERGINVGTGKYGHPELDVVPVGKFARDALVAEQVGTVRADVDLDPLIVDPIHGEERRPWRGVGQVEREDAVVLLSQS
jgi:hypothetical protein